MMRSCGKGIEKVFEPTDLVSSLVSVQNIEHSGKLRVCIDAHTLNKALKREHYPLSVIEDVLPQLSNVKVCLPEADLKEGFLQCKLDEESSILTIFRTGTDTNIIVCHFV